MLNEDISRALHESISNFLREERLDEFGFNWFKRNKKPKVDDLLKQIKKEYEKLISSVFDDSDRMINEAKGKKGGKKNKSISNAVDMARMNKRLEDLTAQNNELMKSMNDYMSQTLAMRKAQEERARQQSETSAAEKRKNDFVKGKQNELSKATKQGQGDLKTIETHTKTIVDGINFINKQITEYLKMKDIKESLIYEKNVGFSGPSIGSMWNMATSSANQGERFGRNTMRAIKDQWKKSQEKQKKAAAIQKKLASIHKNSLILIKRIENADNQLSNINLSPQSFDLEYQGGMTPQDEREYWNGQGAVNGANPTQGTDNGTNPTQDNGVQDNGAQGEDNWEFLINFDDDAQASDTGGTVVQGNGNLSNPLKNMSSNGRSYTQRNNDGSFTIPTYQKSDENDTEIPRSVNVFLNKQHRNVHESSEMFPQDFTKEYEEMYDKIYKQAETLKNLIDGATPITNQLMRASYFDGWSNLVKMPQGNQP